MEAVISLEHYVAIFSLFQNITKWFMELFKKIQEERESRSQRERRKKVLLVCIVILTAVTLAQKT